MNEKDKLVEETQKKLLEEDKIKFKEMSVRVGIVEKGGYYIYVNTDDSENIPHFHVVDNNTRGDEFHSCIKIAKAEYFLHGNKNDKITNSRERKALDKFLREPFKKFKFHGTNWEYIVFIWNDNNSTMQVDEEMPQPDYSNIADDSGI